MLRLALVFAPLVLLGSSCKVDNCTDGPQRCLGSQVVQKCLDGDYIDWEDCEWPDEECAMEEGQA